MNKWIKVSAVAGVALMVGALTLTDVSWAQSTPSTPAPATSPNVAAPWREPRTGSRWARPALFSREEKVAMLAEVLNRKVTEVQQALAQGQTPRELIQAQGFTHATFRAALLKVVDRHLQQAVTDGRITQRQAERLRQRLAKGSGFWAQAAASGNSQPALQAERQAILAEALGLTQAELQQALAAGQTPRQLAQAQGLDQARFAQVLRQAAEQHIQQALTDGRITQRQAERLRARLEDGRGVWRRLR